MRRKAALVVGGWVVLGAGSAAGQSIQHFEPSPAQASGGGFLTEGWRTPGHLKLSADLFANYGHKPLVTVDASGKNETEVVGHMTTLDVVAALSVIDRLLFALDVPLHHLLGDGAEAADKDGFALGDLRLMARGRLLGGDEGFGLALALPVSLPTGDDERFVGDGSVTVNPKVIAGYDFGSLDTEVNAGFRAHGESEKIGATKIGNAITYSGSVGYDFGTLRAIGELFGSVPLEDAGSKETANPLEALLGVRWGFTEGLHLNAGAGLGIIGDAGTPGVRVVMGLGYQMAEEEGGPEVAPSVAEAPPSAEPEPNHAEAGEAEALAAAAARPQDTEPNHAEAGELEAESAARARAESQAHAASVVAARAETHESALDEEPPPNHGKKRREAPPPEVEEEEEEPEAEPPPPPKKKKREAEPAEDEDESGVHRAPRGKVLALGREEAGKGKKGGHKKRPCIYFAEGSVAVDKRAAAELKKLADLFEEAPAKAKLRLSGHTDDSADTETGLRVSKRRAQAVRAWLEKRGVPGDRIVLEWFGDTAPIGKNKTEAGRSVNRRVEYAFVIFDE